MSSGDIGRMLTRRMAWSGTMLLGPPPSIRAGLTFNPGDLAALRRRARSAAASNEDAFRATLERLNDLPIVGEVRGEGYFYGIELVKDKDTKETFNDDE